MQKNCTIKCKRYLINNNSAFRFENGKVHCTSLNMRFCLALLVKEVGFQTGSSLRDPCVLLLVFIGMPGCPMLLMFEMLWRLFEPLECHAGSVLLHCMYMSEGNIKDRYGALT